MIGLDALAASKIVVRLLEEHHIRADRATSDALVRLLVSGGDPTERQVRRAMSAATVRDSGRGSAELAARLAPGLRLALNQSQPEEPYSVLVVTALPLEFRAVTDCLLDGSDTYSNGVLVHRGRHRTYPIDVYVVQSEAGNVQAAQTTASALAAAEPDAVLFVGIAGSLKDAPLRSVVVASWVYELGHISDDGSPNSREKSIPAARAFLQLAGRLAASDDTIRVGPVIGGQVLLKSLTSDTASWIRKHLNDAVAIEMEGFGFSWAAHAAEIPSVVVRGISDRVDDKGPASDAKNQPAAAAAASTVAFELAEAHRKLVRGRAVEAKGQR